MTVFNIQKLREMKRRPDLLAMLMVCLLAAASSGSGEPGEGFRLGRGWSMSPFVEGVVTYDSNVLLRDDEYERKEELNEPEKDDDVFYDLVVGLSLLKEGTDVSLNLRALAQFRRYDIFTPLGDDTFQQSAEAVLGNREKLQVTVNQMYSHVSDYEFTTEESGLQELDTVELRLIEGRTRRTDRYLQEYGVALAHDMSKLQIAGGLAYGKVHFGDDTPIYFPKRDLMDWEEYEGTLNLGYRISDKSSAFITPSFGLHHSENGLDASSYVTCLLGVRSEPTIKLNYAFGGGFQFYSGGTETAEIEDIDLEETTRSEDLDQQFFHYDGKIAWSVTDKLDLQIYGRNEMIPTSAFHGNTKRVDQGSIGLRQLLGRRWLTTLGFSYRVDSYTLPIGGIDALEELVGVQATLQYDSQRRAIQVAAKVRYEEFTSNIQEDYQQLRASLSLNFTY